MLSIFLNFLTAKFLNSILDSSALLLYWKELKNLWQSDKSLKLIWTSNLLQSVYTCGSVRSEILSPCRKWILQLGAMTYNACWMAALAKNNLLLWGSWEMHICQLVSQSELLPTRSYLGWQHCLIYPAYEIFSISLHA